MILMALVALALYDFVRRSTITLVPPKITEAKPILDSNEVSFFFKKTKKLVTKK